MKRGETLDQAKETVTKDREDAYGSPENNFGLIGAFWEQYMNATYDPEECRIQITAKDVATMMILMKVARVATGKPKADNWIDIAGYAACGCEIDTEEPEICTLDLRETRILGLRETDCQSCAYLDRDFGEEPCKKCARIGSDGSDNLENKWEPIREATK